MRKQFVLLWLVVAAGLASAFAAAPDVAYVAFNGADTNPCSRTAPCKTITHALSIVATSGVVDITATGLYDNFTVTKAVTVKADPWFVASIDVVGSTTGITINAGRHRCCCSSEVNRARAGRDGNRDPGELRKPGCRCRLC